MVSIDIEEILPFLQRLENENNYEILEENMYTMNVSTHVIETRVVGVTFENRQAVVALLTEREQVYLLRDPDNSFDSNAVKIVRWDHQQLGYLNRELARIVAPKMDRYGRPVKATVSALTGGYCHGSSLGVVVKFYLPE